MKDLCPSNFLSLTDNMIDTPFLSQITNLTMNVDDMYKDLLEINENYSFYLTDKSIVKQFPPTYLVISSYDTLRDECYKLADFLLQNNVPVEMKEFLYYCHGFLNLTTIIDKSYKEGANQVKRYFEKIFDKE